MNKYGTTNPVLIEARIAHDPYDEFAWVQEWRFAIADVLTFVHGESVPDFTPSPMGPEKDSYAYEMLGEMNRDSEATTENLWYALKILDRYRNWLHIAGKDY